MDRTDWLLWRDWVVVWTQFWSYFVSKDCKTLMPIKRVKVFGFHAKLTHPFVHCIAAPLSQARHSLVVIIICQQHLEKLILKSLADFCTSLVSVENSNLTSCQGLLCCCQSNTQARIIDSKYPDTWKTASVYGVGFRLVRDFFLLSRTCALVANCRKVGLVLNIKLMPVFAFQISALVPIMQHPSSICTSKEASTSVSLGIETVWVSLSISMLLCPIHHLRFIEEHFLKTKNRFCKGTVSV